MSEFVLVLTTLDASGDVAAFARTLVDERLAACVNILPEMESIYRWKSAVETARERQLLIKTVSERLEPLRRRIAELQHRVVGAMALQVGAAESGERRLQLDRAHLGGTVREQRREIAASGAHFQHPVGLLQRELLHHACLELRLPHALAICLSFL